MELDEQGIEAAARAIDAQRNGRRAGNPFAIADNSVYARAAVTAYLGVVGDELDEIDDMDRLVANLDYAIDHHWTRGQLVYACDELRKHGLTPCAANFDWLAAALGQGPTTRGTSSGEGGER